MADASQNLVLRIDGDASGAAAALTQVQQNLASTAEHTKTLGDAADTLGAALAKAFTDPIEALKTFANAVPGVSGAMVDSGNVAQTVSQTLQSAFTDPIGSIESLASAISSGLGSALTELSGPIGVAAGLITGMVGAVLGVGVAVFELTDHAAKAGEEVLGFSEKTGIAVENIGALQFAVTAAGGSLDSLSMVLRMVDMKEATDAGGKFSAALKDIGINAQAFSQMDAESKIMALAAAFKANANNANLANDAMAIGGRRMLEQIPMLDKMTAGLLATGAALGVTWTKAQTEEAENFSLAVGTIETAISDVATKIGQAMLPALTDTITKFVASKQFSDDLVASTVALAHGLGTVVTIATDLTGALGFVVVAGEKVIAAFDGLEVSVYKAGLAAATFIGSAGGIKNYTALLADATTHQKAMSAAADATKAAFGGVFNAGQQVAAALDKMTASSVTAGAGFDKDLNAKTTAASAATAAFGKAVDGIVASLEGESKKTQETAAAITIAIAATNLDADARARVVAAIEKQAQAGGVVTQAMRDYVVANDDSVKSTENLNAILASINPTTAETATAMLKAGQSIGYIATETGLSVDQIKALQVQLKDTSSATSVAQAAMDAYNAAVQKGAGDTLKAQLDANEKWYLDEIAKVNFVGLSAQQLNDLLTSLQAAQAAKDDQARQAELAKEQTFADATQKLWQESYALQETDKQTDLDKKLTEDAQWYEEQLAALDEQDAKKLITTQQYLDRLAALKADFQAKDAAAEKEAQQAALQAQQQQYQQYVNQIETDAENLMTSLNGGWTNFETAAKNVLKSILDYFEESFIKGLIGSMQGQQGAFTSAFSGLFGGGAGGGAAGGGAGGGGGLIGVLGGLFGLGNAPTSAGSVADQANATANQAEGGGGGAGPDWGGSGLTEALGGITAIGGIADIAAGGNSTLGGMTTGAGIGTMILPGIGTEIGAGIGALAGWIGGLFGGGPSASDITSQFEQGQGGASGLSTELSGLGMEGTSMQTALEGTTDAASATAEVTKITDVLNQLNGTEALTQQTADSLLTTITAGGPGAAAATKSIDTAFQNLEATGVDSVGVWNTALESFVQNVQSSGANVQSVTQALQQQVTNASTGLNTALGITDQAMKAAAADQQTIATGTADAAATATTDLATQQAIIAETSIQSQSQAGAVADSIFATVAANEKLGQSFVQALQTAQPAIQGLQDQLTATGYSGGAAFASLNSDLSIVTGTVSGPAIQAVEGYTSSVVGLSNAGLLTQGEFAGLESQIGSTASALEAQGDSSSDVMDVMQGDLQTAWEMEQNYGYTVDASTQALIDQGVQAGIVGEKHEDATDQMIDGINTMDADLEKLIDHFEGISTAAATAAQNVQDSFNSVQVPNWNPPMPGAPAGTAVATTGPGGTGAATWVTGSGSDSSGNPTIVGVGDAPLTAVAQAGLYVLKPGDIYGMPSLTPDLGMIGTGSQNAALQMLGATVGGTASGAAAVTLTPSPELTALTDTLGAATTETAASAQAIQAAVAQAAQAANTAQASQDEATQAIVAQTVATVAQTQATETPAVVDPATQALVTDTATQAAAVAAMAAADKQAGLGTETLSTGLLGPTLSEATWSGTFGDAPLTAVETEGPVWLKPGDIYGMPHLTQPGIGPLQQSPDLSPFSFDTSPTVGSSAFGSSGSSATTTVQLTIQTLDASSFRRFLASGGGDTILKYFEQNDGGGVPFSPRVRLQRVAAGA